MRWLRQRSRGKPLPVVLVSLVVLAAWLSLTQTGRAYGRATLLVTDLLSPTAKSMLHIVTAPAQTQMVSITVPGASMESLYYQPAGRGPHGALILVAGYPVNITDPQLNRVAEGLARLGYAVLIPRLPNLRVGELVPADTEALVAAFEWLAARPEVSASDVGFAGFCVGSSLALVAAENTRINKQVALVHVFGGYYDAMTYIRAIATHSARYEDREYPWQPSRQTVALYAQNMVRFVDGPGEQATLQQLFQDDDGEQEAPETSSPFGTLTYRLLTTSEPAQVDALLAQYPDNKRAELALVSPSANIENLHARVFIMHDASDPFVPVTESYHLADAIQDPDQKVTTYLTLFEHVRPSRSLNRLTLVWEGIKLVIHLSEVLAALTPR